MRWGTKISNTIAATRVLRQRCSLSVDFIVEHRHRMCIAWMHEGQYRNGVSIDGTLLFAWTFADDKALVAQDECDLELNQWFQKQHKSGTTSFSGDMKKRDFFQWFVVVISGSNYINMKYPLSENAWSVSHVFSGLCNVFF